MAKYFQESDRIWSLAHLNELALARKCVTGNWRWLHGHMPAAFVLSMHGSRILEGINKGMYLYKPIIKEKK